MIHSVGKEVFAKKEIGTQRLHDLCHGRIAEFLMYRNRTDQNLLWQYSLQSFCDVLDMILLHFVGYKGENLNSFISKGKNRSQSQIQDFRGSSLVAVDYQGHRYAEIFGNGYVAVKLHIGIRIGKICAFYHYKIIGLLQLFKLLDDGIDQVSFIAFIDLLKRFFACKSKHFLIRLAEMEVLFQELQASVFFLFASRDNRFEISEFVRLRSQQIHQSECIDGLA